MGANSTHVAITVNSHKSWIPLALYGLLPEARPEQLGRDHDHGSASRHPTPTASAAVAPGPSVLLVTVTCDDEGRIESSAISRPIRIRCGVLAASPAGPGAAQPARRLRWQGVLA